jgi:hypothetical protein
MTRNARDGQESGPTTAFSGWEPAVPPTGHSHVSSRWLPPLMPFRQRHDVSAKMNLK